ncbi:putative ATP-binding protein [Mycobacteroides abscessus subsp. abscessus]|nr:putative ATP-binding protein [Mycobacteroides abscessus subsp. abscessus]
MSITRTITTRPSNSRRNSRCIHGDLSSSSTVSRPAYTGLRDWCDWATGRSRCIPWESDFSSGASLVLIGTHLDGDTITERLRTLVDDPPDPDRERSMLVLGKYLR